MLIGLIRENSTTAVVIIFNNRKSALDYSKICRVFINRDSNLNCSGSLFLSLSFFSLALLLFFCFTCEMFFELKALIYPSETCRVSTVSSITVRAYDIHECEWTPRINADAGVRPIQSSPRCRFLL